MYEVGFILGLKEEDAATWFLGSDLQCIFDSQVETYQEKTASRIIIFTMEKLQDF